MTVAVIMAAGSGQRWANYGGTPKHLAVLAGERLLDRSVRLARANGATRVVVLGPDDDRYRVPGAELHTPPVLSDDTPGLGATKFFNTRPYWSATDRTVLLYGDVWFSDDAMARIMGDERREWLHWCRFGPSRFTGCRHGECFAVTFWPEHHASYLAALERTAAAHAAGTINRSGGWEVARAIHGVPDARLRKHRMHPQYQIIDDWTEDLDSPADYDEWVARRGQHTDVSVLVPYRGDGGHRDRAWVWLRKWWAEQHPTWQVVLGSCPSGPWMKAHAVNDALTRADGDILVVADADVWCDGLTLAVDAVRAGAPWAVPHGLVHRLSEQATAAVVAGATPGPRLGGYAQRPYQGYEGGGIVVLTRHAYQRVPLDPRFAGWGGEDEAWALALGTVLGRRWRGTAPLWHAWHEPQKRLNRHVGSQPSQALLVRYQYAAKDGKRAMRKLLAEIVEEGAGTWRS
ncbi:NTP transferase domain-containing protein [Plantactinospora sp. WMMB782]|uniref:NTP transferase domain-containing protein n=1 Tax=Plantactinospora sp. WMMB782 TaxID=3404121 RepID=UPI003B94B5AD